MPDNRLAVRSTCPLVLRMKEKLYFQLAFLTRLLNTSSKNLMKYEDKTLHVQN